MKTSPRVPDRRRAATRLLSLVMLTAAFGAPACDQAPYLAPTGSVITVYASAMTVPSTGEIDIIASVSPVQNDTLVSFTTTLGTITPNEARTQNGKATVRFRGNGQSGTAVITAFSGSASGKLENVLVGSAAARRVTLTATPQSLPAAGGTADVIARVEDEPGVGVAGILVTFSTTAGTLLPTSAATDAAGVARATLTTDRPAEVRATAGAQSGTVTVAVSTRLLGSFTANPSATSAGTPVTFTVTAGTGANIQSATIEFGDGRQQALGPFTGTATASNAYGASGVYVASVTARDAAGATEKLSTNVIIGGLPITLAATPNPAVVGEPVTYSVGGTNGAQVREYRWTVGDGIPSYVTSGPQTSLIYQAKGVKTTRVDVIGVNGTVLGSQTILVVVN